LTGKNKVVKNLINFGIFYKTDFDKGLLDQTELMHKQPISKILRQYFGGEQSHGLLDSIVFMI
jgi:hypothetical protein